MTIVAATVAGFLTGRLLWIGLRSSFAAAAFERLNFRGRLVPTAGGLIVPLAVLLVEAGRVVGGAAGLGEEGLGEPRLAVLAGTAAFGLVGLLDDLATPSGARGFKGHLGALTRGRLTTGAAKLAGGGAAALIVVGLLEPESGLDSLLRDALLIALAANLVNLFDRAPGRALKAVGASFVVIVVALGAASVLAPAAVAVGAGLALLLDDLHERVMLGDTGANALGAALGIAAVVGLSATGRTVVAVVLVVLNGLSEVVSFGRVIDGFAPLRAVDRAGRRP